MTTQPQFIAPGDIEHAHVGRGVRPTVEDKKHVVDSDLPKLRENAEEPPYSSVVMSEGITGTIYQRFQSDGLWHSPSGRVKTWESLTMFQPRKRQYLLLLHWAPEES